MTRKWLIRRKTKQPTNQPTDRPLNQTLSSDSQQLQIVHENHLGKRPVLVNRRNTVLFFYNARPHLARILREKYCILAVLFNTIHYIYSPDFASSDFHFFPFSKKCSGRQKYFSRSSKNFCGKLRELKTNWILHERNQHALRKMTRDDSKYWRIYYWLKSIHCYIIHELITLLKT